MSTIKIFDTERGYRYIVPQLRKAGIDIDVEKDIVIGNSLTALVSLMDEIERSVPDEKYLRYMKAIFYGRAGSGKSYSATQMMIGMCQEKTNAPILLIDSATIIWKQYVETYMRENNVKRMTLQNWGVVIPAFENILNMRLRTHNYNIILTGRMGYVYEMVEDEETHKKSFQKVDTKAKLSSETAHEPDLVIEMEQLKKRDGEKVEIVQQATILKDRANRIHGHTCINPDWQFFKPVWDYLNLEIPEKPKEDSTNDSELVRQEEQNLEGKRLKQTTLEEIWGLFERLGLGTSAAAKQIKVGILERIFLTRSKSKIEAMGLNQLQGGLMQLEEDTEIKAMLEAVKQKEEAGTV